MKYSAGLLHQKVTIARRNESTTSRFGKDGGGISWTRVGTFWANVTFSKGVKAMREGAVDAYDTIMVRMRWRDDVDRECLLKHDGRWFNIESFHREYEDNMIQMTCREMANSTVELYEWRQLATVDDEPLQTDDDQILTARVLI